MLFLRLVIKILKKNSAVVGAYLPFELNPDGMVS